VLGALKDPAQKNNRDHVDVIIALGMAKEGFDWIWCEHALTIGYRSSLTEIVQIIGRATRDAKGKERSRFTNLIAEPAAEQSAVSRGGERHAQGHLRQPADGAGAGAAL
jgi:superfamily II DNA or RNA helicase